MSLLNLIYDLLCLSDFSDNPLSHSMIDLNRKLILEQFQNREIKLEIYDNETLFIIKEQEIDQASLERVAFLNNRGVITLFSDPNLNLRMFKEYVIHPIFFNSIKNLNNLEEIDMDELNELIEQITAGRDIKFSTTPNIELYYVEELMARLELNDLSEVEACNMFNKAISKGILLKNDIMTVINGIMDDINYSAKSCNEEAQKATTNRKTIEAKEKLGDEENQEIKPHLVFKENKLIDENDSRIKLGYRKKVPAYFIDMKFKPLREYYYVHEKAQNLNTILDTDFCSFTLFFPLFPSIVNEHKDDPYLIFKKIFEIFRFRAPNFYKILNDPCKNYDQIIKPPTITEVHQAFLELGYSPPNYLFISKLGNFDVDNHSEITVIVYNKHVELYVGQPILDLPLNLTEHYLYLNNIQQFRNGYKGDYQNV